MATFNSKNKEELKAIAIEKGFKPEELADLTKAELIEVIETAEHGDGGNTGANENSEAPVNKGSVKLESLDGFKGTEVHVHEQTGDGKGDHTFIRTYSEEVHGENFLDLARSFVNKKPGRFFVK